MHCLYRGSKEALRTWLCLHGMQCHVAAHSPAFLGRKLQMRKYQMLSVTANVKRRLRCPLAQRALLSTETVHFLCQIIFRIHEFSPGTVWELSRKPECASARMRGKRRHSRFGPKPARLVHRRSPTEFDHYEGPSTALDRSRRRGRQTVRGSLCSEPSRNHADG